MSIILRLSILYKNNTCRYATKINDLLNIYSTCMCSVEVEHVYMGEDIHVQVQVQVTITRTCTVNSRGRDNRECTRTYRRILISFLVL